MATDIVYDALRSFLEQNWNETELRFENEGEDPPRDQQKCWIYVEMTGDFFDQMSIGAGTRADNRWEETGSLVLHIAAPRGLGSKEPRRIARLLADLFRSVDDLGSIEFGTMSIGLGGTGDENGNWFMLPFRVEWRRIA